MRSAKRKGCSFHWWASFLMTDKKMEVMSYG
jgi:hypothetical protein